MSGRQYSSPRCDEWCDFPCAKDHRTKAEKIAAMVAGATTPGEKAAAQAAADRQPVAPPPEPKPQGVPLHWAHTTTRTTNASSFGARSRTYYSPPTPEEARPAGRQTSEQRFRDEYMGSFDNRTPPPESAYSRRMREQAEHQDALNRELLKQAQARESLRRAGFVTPDDPGFEAEYTARAADQTEAFIGEAVRRSLDELLQRLRGEGKMHRNDTYRTKEE